MYVARTRYRLYMYIYKYRVINHTLFPPLDPLFEWNRQATADTRGGVVALHSSRERQVGSIILVTRKSARPLQSLVGPLHGIVQQ